MKKQHNVPKTYKKFCVKCGVYFQPLTKFSKNCEDCKKIIKQKAVVKSNKVQRRNSKIKKMEEKNLNYDLYKEGYEKYKKLIENIFIKLLNEVPREKTIELLKKKKYIKRDWLAKGEQYYEN